MPGIGDSGGITVEWEELFGVFLVFIYLFNLFVHLLIYLFVYLLCV